MSPRRYIPPPATETEAETSSDGTGGTYSTNISPSNSESSQLGIQPKEADLYYYGLPSCPRLVARSGNTPWEAPQSLEGRAVPKVLNPVGRHAIRDPWEKFLYHEIAWHLSSKKVAWTGIDVVRIGYKNASDHPVILWIGVRPKSLSVEDGTKLAHSSHDILIQNGITDVDVEIRESLVLPLQGPALLPPDNSCDDPAAEVRIPLTATLGHPISNKDFQRCEGTGGFFIAEGGGSNRLFLVTTRHAVFPKESPIGADNRMFDSNNRDHKIVLLGSARFLTLLNYVQSKSGGLEHIIVSREKRLAKMKHNGSDMTCGMPKKVLEEMLRAKEAKNVLNNVVAVLLRWQKVEDRILGHAVYSPPIRWRSGEMSDFLQDFALIEIDLSKLNADNFSGNIIDLGTGMSGNDLIEKMSFEEHCFEYPDDRLLNLSGTIPDEELTHPPPHRARVLKRGSASGLTVGQSTDIRSCLRGPDESNPKDYGLAWAILALDPDSPFSKPGDSGAVVVDGQGHIGGMITGGAGLPKSGVIDITYATGINFLMERIRVKFPNAHLNPVLPG